MNDNVDIIEFSDWLSHELKRRNMTQADLVRVSGLSSSQISRILSMQRPPGMKALTAIANGLRLPPELVYQKAALFKTDTVDEIDLLITEVETILEGLSEPDRNTILELARYLYARQKQEEKTLTRYLHSRQIHEK